MKILVSAIACNPHHGSESAVGWSAVAALMQEHEVWVLLHERNRSQFQEWLQNHTLPGNLHLHFIGKFKPWHPNRMIARIGSWVENYSWHRNLLEPALKLHREIQFDLVHHVTYATWRVASPLWQLGVPFVWGPLGGGEIFPWQVAGILSPVALAFEMVRSTSNCVSSHSRAVRQCARNATVCIAGNRETHQMLARIRGTEQGIETLCVNFFQKDKIERFIELLPRKTTGGALRMFSGGNLEGRKGVAITLQALSLIKNKGVPFSYRPSGSGPEAAHLKNLSEKLCIAEDVIFGEGFKGDAYLDELIRSHIYLLPSLRDNSGRTLMEAMLAGCVPIVADGGGPAEIVTDECGFRIKVSTPRQMAGEIANVILRLNADRSLLDSLGKAAHARISERYSEASYKSKLNAIYKNAISGKSK